MDAPCGAVADLLSAASVPWARSEQKAETMSALRVGVFMRGDTQTGAVGFSSSQDRRSG
jgi:hypothetical protein